MSKPQPPAGFALLLTYITPHRRVLLVVLGLLLAGSLLSLANPWMAGLLTASVMNEGEQGIDVRLLLALWMGLMIISALVKFASRYFIGNTGERITAATSLPARSTGSARGHRLARHRDWTPQARRIRRLSD